MLTELLTMFAWVMEMYYKVLVGVRGKLVYILSSTTLGLSLLSRYLPPNIRGATKPLPTPKLALP
jgi:hypothetical protein